MRRKALQSVLIRALTALLMLWMASLASLANPYARNDF
jgi:hypothetical protein